MDATLQHVFRMGYERYRAHHGMSLDQHQAAQAIMSCGSDALGSEEWVCVRDGYLIEQPHSCRHRSCPRCQYAERERWLKQAQARLLPCDHFHVVFTLPHELNEVWQYNRRWCADKLFKAAAETLRELLGDERYLGAEPGMLMSLHTWGRTLSFHPHVHVLVTGGGVRAGRWKGVAKDYLLPVGVVKAKFRGKWLSWLNAGYARCELTLPAHWRERDWRKALSQVARKNWNVRIQGPYRHGGGVVNYLSRYLRGGPIQNRRLVKVDADRVWFRYRDHRDDKDKVMTLRGDQFIRRILWHVPVKGQHNVRYYGLYLPGASDRRDAIRDQLDASSGEEAEVSPKPAKCCPYCGEALWHFRSSRRRISYIKYPSEEISDGAIVQQGVRADRDQRRWLPPPGSWKKFYVVPRRHN